MWLFSVSGTAVPLFLCLLQCVSGNYVITWPKTWFVGTPLQFCIALDTSARLGDAITVQLWVQKDSYNYPDIPEFEYAGGTKYFPQELIERLDILPETMEIALEKNLTPEYGKMHSCVSLFPPKIPSYQQVKVRVTGTLRGAPIDESRFIYALSVKQTFIQTDKEKYKPGQKVQFRMLSLDTPDMKVSTESYDLIYVRDPAGTRIKQWRNVPNPNGLIHLEFQLVDEPKEGYYSIYLESKDSFLSKGFEVEKYVLPRFEVTFDARGYVLATDETLEFEVCVQYTFGEPVRGSLAINVNNGKYGTREREVNYESTIQGCKLVEIPLSALEINKHPDFVYGLRITVKVVEEGTDVAATEQLYVSVSRTALSFQQQNTELPEYPKPELPYFTSVRVSFNDGRPAAQESLKVCTNRWVLPSEVQRIRQEIGCFTIPSGIGSPPMTICPEAVCKYVGTNKAGIPVSACFMSLCRDRTTDDSGILQVTIPPHFFTKDLTEAVVEIRSNNYPDLYVEGTSKRYKYMNQPKTNIRLSDMPYFSPSNSSLLIKPDDLKLDCTPGKDIQLQLPVMYAVRGFQRVSLYVQAVSRGQIKFWSTFTVWLTGLVDIDFDETTLVEPMLPPSSMMAQRGMFTLPLTLPHTISPSVRVLIWYVRNDGEVVSDVQSLSVSKCLNYPVELSWPSERVEFGTDLPLTLTSQPNALCSVGIVDKSVELLSGQSSLINEIFYLPSSANQGYYSSSSQSDNFEHCLKQICRGNFAEDGRSEKQPSLRLLGAPSRYVYPSTSFIIKHVDALQIFDNAHLHVITDQILETRPCEKGGSSGGPVYGLYGSTSLGGGSGGLLSGLLGGGGQAGVGGGGQAGVGGDGVVAGLLGGGGGDYDYNDGTESGPITPAIEVKTRVYFPETWLWELRTIPNSGVYVENKTLPDTITEWVGKAVCVHPEEGVGISATSSITTFTSMFIELTLPPTIKVGEILPLKISVFNYYNTSLSVRITLEESSEYEILGINGTEAEADQAAAGERSACVPSQDKATVVVRVRFLVPASVNITVGAEVVPGLVDNCVSGNPLNGRDRIIKPLAVDYAGFLREATYSLYYCGGEEFPSEWPIAVPSEPNIVNNSVRGFVTASAELLGPTLANLGHLIRMPYGCGEQNLARFAPNIYIMRYLERSEQRNATVAQKLISHMNRGYQQQLNYRRRDGSYSVFGNRDQYGSTWLTAFTLKTYVHAADYIAVSTGEIEKTAEWLSSLQLPSGCFQLVGYVHNRRMRGAQGEEAAPGTLSAYVMAALLESGISSESEVIIKAAACIEAATAPGAIGEDDNYLLALKAYAFSLAGLNQTHDVIDDLFTRSEENTNGIYWRIENHYRWYSKSLSVETTSYVLLAMLNSNYTDPQGRKIRLLKWITSNRNGRGGFVSTQDTVIALQALALFGSPVPKTLNMTVGISGGGIMETFEVNDENRLLQQRKDLEFVPELLTTEFEGEGCALVETVVRYNVEDPDASEVFSLSVSSRIDYGAPICQSNIIRVCATYILGYDESNMGIIEVNLVSGYTPDIASLNRAVSDVTGSIKRYDVDGSQVIFYVDQFTDSQVCVEFTASETTEVELTSPGTVKVYDYYEPDFFVSEVFDFRRRFCKLD